jgi:zinc transport system permease protein
MIEAWHHLAGLLPFSWAHYAFMKNSLLAVLLVAPCFGLVGTMVVGNRMAFFSDMIGHSALTGVALGMIVGLADPRPVMVVFAVFLAIAVNAILKKTRASNDTVIGVFFAFTIALGVALLSRGGEFRKYTVYLVGDILSITPGEILSLALLLALVLVFWAFFGGRLALISVDQSLAYRSALSSGVVLTLFSILVALVVILSLRWVGLLIINSLFILPAASARMAAASLRAYVALSVLFSLLSGVAGLIISFYADTAAGATIVLCAASLYLATMAATSMRSRLFNEKQGG